MALRRMFRRKRLVSRKKTYRKSGVRKAIKIAAGSSKRPPMHIHVVHDVYTINPTSVDNPVVLPINPTTSQRWTEYAALYDTYRVVSAVVEFIPDCNTNNTWMEGTPAVVNTFSQGLLYLKYDKDDAVAPVSQNQCIIENYATRPSLRRFKYKIVPPKYTLSLDDGTQTFGRHSCQDNTKIDGWLKMYNKCPADLPALNLDRAINGYTLIVKYTVVFFDYVSKAVSDQNKTLGITQL